MISNIAFCGLSRAEAPPVTVTAWRAFSKLLIAKYRWSTPERPKLAAKGTQFHAVPKQLALRSQRFFLASQPLRLTNPLIPTARSQLF
jgi:hypothetical protein